MYVTTTMCCAVTSTSIDLCMCDGLTWRTRQVVPVNLAPGVLAQHKIAMSSFLDSRLLGE